MKVYYILLALLAGMMMPTQGAINHKLATYVNSPILASFVSFCIGTVGLLVYLIATGVSFSPVWETKNIPAIAWLGGLLGAFFVASTTVLVPRLGVALTFSLFILGQMLITLVIDHFGLLGVPIKSINWLRIVGVSCIVLGVILVQNN